MSVLTTVRPRLSSTGAKRIPASSHGATCARRRRRCEDKRRARALPPPTKPLKHSSPPGTSADLRVLFTFGLGTKAYSLKRMRPRAASASRESSSARAAAALFRCSSNSQPPKTLTCEARTRG
eukprot:2239968-Pleurochrysis_carterae.AAC.1